MGGVPRIVRPGCISGIGREHLDIFRDQRWVTTDLHDTEWNEKVLIFRDPRGVTTDLLDV